MRPIPAAATAWGGLARDLPVVEEDRAAVRHMITADHVEECRLSRAVGTDEAGDCASVDAEGYVRNGLNPVEMLGQSGNLKHLRFRPKHIQGVAGA